MGTTSSKSILSRIWHGIVSGRTKGAGRESIKSFQEKQKSEEAFSQRDLGKKEVALEKIVGSVGRYNDFNNQFRSVEGLEPYRLKRIKEAMHTGKYLPPIELYKIKDEYYVLDGNHRVAAAKEFGHSSIEAHIIEYLPSKDTLENILYREKADFIWKTGLPDSINLTEVGQYAYLMEQVLDHQYFMEEISHEPIPLKKVADDWYRTIYSPLIRIIQQNHLIKAFPKRTLTDLYAYVSYYQWKKGRRKRRYDIGIDEQIPKSMERFRAKMMEKKVKESPEMKRMATAFLLITVETGKENRIMSKLYAQKEVQEVHFVPGDYDIIVKITVERDIIVSDSEAIGYFVQNIVRRMPGVVRTNTIIPISSKQKRNRQ
jgi:DNA-binding Lrp family transcriptional regulator